MTTIVEDNPTQNRFEIQVDGVVAGFAEYHLHQNQAAFTHTEIESAFGGQGLASTLIRTALDEARQRGWQVEPFCPFVRAFIGKHPEYRDLVPAAQWARFGLS